MISLPTIGLACALLAAPATLLACTAVNADPLGFRARFSSWFWACVVCAIAYLSLTNWAELLGIDAPSWTTLAYAAAGCAAVLPGWPAAQALQNLLGAVRVEATATFGLSLTIFVAAHSGWGVGHLLSVTWAGLVLSLLFVWSHDLVACAIAHTMIDAVGHILAPWGMSLRAKRAQLRADTS